MQLSQDIYMKCLLSVEVGSPPPQALPSSFNLDPNVNMSAVPRGTSGAAIAGTFTAISFLTLAARLFTRYFLVKNAGNEEFAIIFAWVSWQ